MNAVRVIAQELWLADGYDLNGVTSTPDPDTAAELLPVYMAQAEKVLAAVLPSLREVIAAEALGDLKRVTCTICDEIIVPSDDAAPDGDRWAHRDCAEAGE